MLLRQKTCYIPKPCGDSRALDGADITRLTKLCQPFSLQGAKPKKDTAFAARLREAFEGARDAEIARRLGYRSQSPITKFMSGVYPGPEVLIEISRVTKRSIHWLLTGEGETGTDPIGFLPDAVRRIVNRLADQSKKPDDDMMVKLIEEALVARAADIMKRYPTVEPHELDLMSMCFQLFEFEEGATSSARSLKRDAG